MSSQARSPRLELGSRLGDYRVSAFLGPAPLGDRYLAENENWGDQVMLVVATWDERDPEAKQRQFDNGYKAQSVFSHPQLAKPGPLFNHGNMQVLVTQMPSAPSLRDQILLKGFQTWEVAKAWFLPLLDLLDLAHRQGIVLRELRPDGIYPEGPLLVELSMATQLGQPDNGAALAWGDPAYTCPDFLRGLPYVDHLADVYAAGLILYETLTGRPAFLAQTPQDVLQKQLYEDPPLPRTLQPALAPELEAILMRALHKSPDMRFTGCGQFKVELEAWAAKTSANQVATGTAQGSAPSAAQAKLKSEAKPKPVRESASPARSPKLRPLAPEMRISRFHMVYESLFYLIAAPSASLLLGLFFSKFPSYHIGPPPLRTEEIEALYFGSVSYVHPSTTMVFHVVLWWLFACLPKAELRQDFKNALPKCLILAASVAFLAIFAIWLQGFPWLIGHLHEGENLSLLVGAEFDKLKSLTRVWFGVLGAMFAIPLLLSHLIMPSRVPK